MKKIKYFGALALSALMLLTSCEGFLDAENKSAGGQTADEYFRTPEGLATFRVYAYSSLKKIATSNTIQEDGTDLFLPARGKTPSQFQEYSVTPNNGDVQYLYLSCYDVINNANALLDFGGDTYKQDALFLRAYGYYMLTQHFGSVPYSDRYINDAERSYPRTDLATIYTNVINDLETLAADPTLIDLTADGTVNKRAVNALLAKVCLAAGWDLETKLVDEAKGTWEKTGTSYFAKAKNAADAAINGIELTQSFEQKWSPAGEVNNPETFFAVQYEREGYPGDAASGGHGLQNDYGNYYGQIAINGLKVSSSVKVPSHKALFLFEKGDQRYDATFMTRLANYKSDDEWGQTGYYAYYNNPNFNSLPIANFYAPYYWTQAEFEQFLKDNQALFVNADAEGNGYNNAVWAFWMNDPVVKYYFNADGSIQKKEQFAYNRATLDAQLNFTPCVKKWDDPATIQENLNSSNCYRDIVLLHASDIYLVAAEAAYMLSGEAAAMPYLNAVRGRAGLAPLSGLAAYDPQYSTPNSFGELQVIDLILDERARELYAEMQRWMDLRRTRQLVRYNVAFNEMIGSVADMQNNKGETKWYRPIPTHEINSNTAMTDSTSQNPGY